ncbi:hypothetical protein [Hahella ganghwensis]|uniref:hypothetical protein n=1 Tax=Hahella ganghwensis TaxID=286420 RepID=UPI0003679CEF|nr:hypothetical protein [Hahella ganghwensis]
MRQAIFPVILLLSGCVINQAPKESKDLVAAPTMSQEPLVKEVVPAVCKRTKRNLAVSWRDRTYYCGPLVRSLDYSSSKPASVVASSDGRRIIRSLQYASPVVKASAAVQPVVKAAYTTSSKNARVEPSEFSTDQVTDLKNNATPSDQKELPGYNFTVVYKFPIKPPREELWDTLERLSESDKWKGGNSGNFFIYVGAYFDLPHAQRRQKNLASLTGVTPVIKQRLTE